jgi:hypothetical protein
MNEVEKMYENAGIEKSCNSDLEFCPVEFCDECNLNIYPEFTAEKQLELIKWLAYKMHITIGKGLPWGQYDDDWWTITSKKGYAGTNAHKFEEALANFLNCFWQDLTEEEQKQVRGILE